MGNSSDMNLQALSAADVASLLGVSQNLVYKLAREGVIPLISSWSEASLHR